MNRCIPLLMVAFGLTFASKPAFAQATNLPKVTDRQLSGTTVALANLPQRTNSNSVRVAKGKTESQAIERGVDWPLPKNGIPNWLTAKDAAREAEDRLLAIFNTKVEADYAGIPLQQIMSGFADDLNIPIWINTGELDLLGVDPQTPISLSLPNTSFKSVLRLMLEPLELTFVVRNEVMEITSKDSANIAPSVAYYDLAWVLERREDTSSLLVAITNTIDPDCWVENGGASSLHAVGRVLIVSASRSTQEKIRTMLKTLHQFRLQASTPSDGDSE
ncbi:MAG: hypothetical protein ACE361_00085 [Aureliella sp.]